MIRSTLSAVLATASVAAIGFLPASCETGGIGDPCTPEDEFQTNFSGFKVTQENIESRSFQCESRLCLVNHFQGRVSCPLGQPPKEVCTGTDGTCTNPDEKCVLAGEFAAECTKETAATDCAKYAGTCNAAGYCDCSSNDQCPENYVCDVDGTHRCEQYVCHEKGNCQDPNAEGDANWKDKANGIPKDCCVPGTDDPVGVEVCGQCAKSNDRAADKAVFCSCRCGVAEGQPEDDNFNFCDCPDGFICAEVRPNVGLGDPQLSGKYCVHADDPIVKDEKVQVADAALNCKKVDGWLGGGATTEGGQKLECEGTK